ncbi:MAG: TIGR01212 family radical SAM protein [Clostridia bacterium]|nr:TIGR01212 family radical SAM protein [Clostridia bacterium]
MPKPYRDLAGYLKEKTGCKTAKICIDGGFTCPNRDGRCSTGGCAFCGARGAGEFTIDPAVSIGEQVRVRLANPLGGRRAARFLAYFQNFSATYAPADELRRRYDAALCDERIVGLAVATRPDCIDEEIAALLGEYAARMPVWVELGLQTASEKTAGQMNIACPRAAFAHAVSLLRARGVDSVAHMMVGLPGEGLAEAMDTLRLINAQPVAGIKIHSLYVMRGTALEALWRQGEYTPLTFDMYTETVARLIAGLRPDIVVHRLTGDCPRDTLLAPGWSAEKNKVLDRIHTILRERGWHQGCLYEKDCLI